MTTRPFARSVLVAAAAVSLVLVGGCASSGSTSSGDAAPASDPAPIAASTTSPEKVAQAVGVAYQSMALSVSDFLNTDVDMNDLETSQVASAAKLPPIRKDYDYFHLVVSSLTSDSQLAGQGMPTVASLQQMDSVMGQWLGVRENYLAELSNCFGTGDQMAYMDCADPVFSRYETQLVDTAADLSTAVQAVDGSVN